MLAPLLRKSDNPLTETPPQRGQQQQQVEAKLGLALSQVSSRVCVCVCVGTHPKVQEDAEEGERGKEAAGQRPEEPGLLLG